MKTSIKKHKKMNCKTFISTNFIVGLLVISSVLGACTENFEERNTSPTGLETLSPEDVKSLFPNALYRGWNQGSYQTGQNLTADTYAQFLQEHSLPLLRIDMLSINHG